MDSLIGAGVETIIFVMVAGAAIYILDKLR